MVGDIQTHILVLSFKQIPQYLVLTAFLVDTQCSNWKKIIQQVDALKIHIRCLVSLFPYTRPLISKLRIEGKCLNILKNSKVPSCLSETPLNVLSTVDKNRKTIVYTLIIIYDNSRLIKIDRLVSRGRELMPTQPSLKSTTDRLIHMQLRSFKYNSPTSMFLFTSQVCVLPDYIYSLIVLSQVEFNLRSVIVETSRITYFMKLR